MVSGRERARQAIGLEHLGQAEGWAGHRGQVKLLHTGASELSPAAQDGMVPAVQDVVRKRQGRAGGGSIPRTAPMAVPRFYVLCQLISTSLHTPPGTSSGGTSSQGDDALTVTASDPHPDLPGRHSQHWCTDEETGPALT